jgi:RNA-binding protein
LSPSRNLILNVESPPRIGETVVDENLKTVGTVLDTFGPVRSPYVAIRATIADPEKLVNKTLYVVPSKRRKEKARDEWRRRT